MIYSAFFFQASWYLAIGIFVYLFIFALMKARHVNMTKKYGVWLTVFLVAVSSITLGSVLKTTIQTRLQAQRSAEPKELILTKESARKSMRIEWVTDKEVIEYLRYREVGGDWKIVLDEQGFVPTNYHRVHMRNLTPGLRYTFEIRYGDTSFARFQGRPMEFTF